MGGLEALMLRDRIPFWVLLLALVLPLSLATGVYADEDDEKNPAPKGEDDGKDKGKEDEKPARPAKPAKYGVGKLQRQLDDIRDRLIQLAEQANKDPREREIEEYAAYTLEQFKEKKRVKVRDLVDYIFDSEAPFELVRMKAVLAIEQVNRTFLDPDLSTERKGSSPSPRSAFCKSHVVPKLKDKDQKSRLLADMLLEKLWNGKPATLMGPKNYRPQKKHSKTWGQAISDWKKYLKRR